MATTLREVVEPRTPGRPRYGLVVSAPVDSEPNAAPGQQAVNGQRWHSGLTFTPAPCGLGGGTFDPCSNTTDFAAGEAVQAAVGHEPVGLVYDAECSTFGFGALDVEERARVGLDLATSRLLEAEFWGGARATSAAWADNRFLNKNAAPGGPPTQPNGTTATAPIRALADFEQALADCRAGGRGFIHVTPRTASIWWSHQLLRREGNLLLTALDTIVVPGEGYPGTAPGGAAPAANTAWAYATGDVQVYLSEIRTYEPNGQEITTENLRHGIATRMAAAVYDPCCHIGILVKHTHANDV